MSPLLSPGNERPCFHYGKSSRRRLTGMIALANDDVASHHQELPSEPPCLHSLSSATTLPSHDSNQPELPHRTHYTFSSLFKAFGSVSASSVERFRAVVCVLQETLCSTSFDSLYFFPMSKHCTPFYFFLLLSGRAGAPVSCLESFLSLFGGVFATRIPSFKQGFLSLVAFWLDDILRAEQTVSIVQGKNKNRKALHPQRKLLHSNVTPRKVLAAVSAYYSRMCSQQPVCTVSDPSIGLFYCMR